MYFNLTSHHPPNQTKPNQTKPNQWLKPSQTIIKTIIGPALAQMCRQMVKTIAHPPWCLATKNFVENRFCLTLPSIKRRSIPWQAISNQVLYHLGFAPEPSLTLSVYCVVMWLSLKIKDLVHPELGRLSRSSFNFIQIIELAFIFAEKCYPNQVCVSFNDSI